MLVYKYDATAKTADNRSIVVDGTFEDLLRHERAVTRYYNACIEVERWKKAAQYVVSLDPNGAERKQEVHDAYLAARRQAYAEATELGWGTKQAVDDSVKAALRTAYRDEQRALAEFFAGTDHSMKAFLRTQRPRFQRHTGEVTVAATLQGCTGLTTEDVLNGNKNFSIVVREREGGKKSTYARLRLSEKLTVEILIAYRRRPLPPGTRVLYARLVKTRIASEWQYHVCVTLDAKPKIKNTGTGSCSVNFGWRKVPGGVRVAYAVGDHGEHECVIPNAYFASHEHVESLRSLGDEIADLYLGVGERRAKHRNLVLSQPHVKNLRHLKKVWFTKEQAAKRSRKDLEHWALRDRHLNQWECFRRAKLIRQRDVIYRRFAYELGKLYEKCTIETFNMSEVLVRSKADAPPASRRYRFLVAPYMVRMKVKAVFGESLTVLPPAKHTVTCSSCGELCNWNQKKEVRHRCEHCGAEWDQDANNARNQRRAIAAE